MDSILFRDLRIEVMIGIYRREKHVPQTVSIDLDIGDGEAARALLDEVMAEGSESQRLRAQRLLSDIG